VQARCLLDYPTETVPEGTLKFWGVYKLTVGSLAAAETVAGMLRTAYPPETSIWGAFTLAASVLLAIDGLAELIEWVHRWVFVAIAVVIPIAISTVSDDWPQRLWMFSIAMGFSEWVFQELKRSTARTDIGALACCAVLAVSLANTTVMVFRTYWDEPQFWPLGQIFKFMAPIALPWTLILIMLWRSGHEVAGRGLDPREDVALAAEAVDR